MLVAKVSSKTKSDLSVISGKSLKITMILVRNTCRFYFEYLKVYNKAE